MLPSRPSAKVWLVVPAVVAFCILTPAAALADPPGNNGTVKIDALAFDDHPDNEPHVGCSFQVDFYGFDAGNLGADVLFQAWPPTGGGETLETDTVFIGEDTAGGGTDLDASRTYSLDFGSLVPHPKQGFHVKVTVNAEGSIGADVKHKVFWTGPCGYAPDGVDAQVPQAPDGDATVAEAPMSGAGALGLIALVGALSFVASRTLVRRMARRE